MYPWQGLNFLTPAIKLAAEIAPEITFVLAVNQRIDTLPSTKNVVVKESLNREQILDEICSADLCVAFHPEYFWSKWGFHGSPMKMFEYMACSSTVLASNIGQMKDLLTHGESGLLCANNPDDILKQIMYAKDNPKVIQKIATNGWQKIQNEFSWENNVRTTIGKFTSLISIQ